MDKIASSDMSIGTRIAQFSAIVRETTVTGRNGASIHVDSALADLAGRLVELREARGGLYLFGNGGSAAIAGHAATDFFNVGRLKATTLHESSLMTCMSNDFGYENAYARQLAQWLRPGDMVIAISSSGNSANIRNAAKESASKGAYLVTMSGFCENNPLRGLGDLNFWLNSKDYGYVEVGHQFLLHNVSDRLNENIR